MKKFLPVFLLSISFLILNGCVSIRDFEKENIQPTILSPVLDDGYQTALYKVKIDKGSKYFSGLFYFKTFTDTSYRIIFMSELGLNMLDLEYKNNSFKIISCQKFMRKKVVINALKNDLKLLITLPENTSKKCTYKSTNNQATFTKVKIKSKRYYYYYNQNGEMSKIILTKGLKHIVILLTGYKNNIPQEIEIYHKRINLSIKFSLIEVK